MIQKIVEAKNPILRQKSKPVGKIDKKVKALAKDLLDTISAQRDPEGVGLAAVQIGKLVCMFAMLWKKGFRIIINPEIIKTGGRPKTKRKEARGKTILEGCLSIPNIYGPLKRFHSVTLKFTDLNGEEMVEKFEGFPAQIVQHEVDHLNGTLFIDKSLKQKAPLYKYNNSKDDWEEVEL